MEGIIQEVTYYSHTYNIIATVDYYDRNKKMLVEKKRRIKKVYDGYVFQLYAQYFALKDNGEKVEKIFLYDISAKSYYPIPLPEENLKLKKGFETVLKRISTFNIYTFHPNNVNKCKNCIYNNLCDRSLYD